MLIKILIGVVVVLALLVILIATRPAEFHVARSTKILALPAAAFHHVNELKRWEAWNPWGKLDPAMKLTYDGPEAGQGASYAWNGNSQVGEGRLTIVESKPDELVRVKLEFLRPFAATNSGEFTFKPEADGTVVTWSMDGRKNFITKAMGLVMSMDAMIGGQFEKGLADLKKAVENEKSS